MRLGDGLREPDSNVHVIFVIYPIRSLTCNNPYYINLITVIILAEIPTERLTLKIRADPHHRLRNFVDCRFYSTLNRIPTGPQSFLMNSTNNLLHSEVIECENNISNKNNESR